MKKYNLDGFDCDWEPSWIDDKVEMEDINNAITIIILNLLGSFVKH